MLFANSLTGRGWEKRIEMRNDTVAEIKIERKQRGILPWITLLVLLVLVVWGLSKVANAAHESPVPRHGEAAADKVRDDTPPRLRQYA